MSRGVSYLAAYRLAKAQSTQVAYKQAIGEIRNAQAQAKAYADLIQSLDEQILEYNKLQQKVMSEQDPAVKNEILQAEIALAQVNERNAGNKVAVYRYADERFDAPSRTDSQIAGLNGDRATAYTGNVSTLMNKVKATHQNVFSGLTPEQQQDAAIKLYDAIISEGNAARTGSGVSRYTAADDINIRKEIASMVGQTDPTFISPLSHAQAKQDYIDGILGQAVGSTRRLRNAIDTAAQQRTVTAETLDTVLTEVAVAAAADGFDEGDQSLLMSGIASLYQPDSRIEITRDNTKLTVPFSEASEEELRGYYRDNNIPTTIDELFARRSVASDPRVIKSKRAGQQLTQIKQETGLLKERRAEAIQAQAEQTARLAEMQSPESLRERQAEIFAQTLSPEEREKYLTPEQMKRIEGLEGQATTAAQMQEEQLAAPSPSEATAGMTAEQINTMRAMTAAVQAQRENKDISMNDLEQDVYAAMSEQMKSGNIAPQDIYKQSERLGKQMGGLADSQRNFAQTVASRIYLDMYNDLQAQMPATTEPEVKKKETDTDASDTGF